MQRAFSDVQKATGGTIGTARTPSTFLSAWAAQYKTWLLIKLLLKGTASVLDMLCSLSCPRDDMVTELPLLVLKPVNVGIIGFQPCEN